MVSVPNKRKQSPILLVQFLTHAMMYAVAAETVRRHLLRALGLMPVDDTTQCSHCSRIGLVGRRRRWLWRRVRRRVLGRRRADDAADRQARIRRQGRFLVALVRHAHAGVRRECVRPVVSEAQRTIARVRVVVVVPAVVAEQRPALTHACVVTEEAGRHRAHLRRGGAHGRRSRDDVFVFKGEKSLME